MHLNCDSSENITLDHLSFDQPIYFLANAILLSFIFWVNKGFLAALLQSRFRSCCSRYRIVRKQTLSNKSGYIFFNSVDEMSGCFCRVLRKMSSVCFEVFLGFPDIDLWLYVQVAYMTWWIPSAARISLLMVRVEWPRRNAISDIETYSSCKVSAWDFSVIVR